MVKSDHYCPLYASRNPAGAQEGRSKQIFCKNSHFETLSHTYSNAIPPLFVSYLHLFVIFHTLSNVSKSPTPIFPQKILATLTFYVNLGNLNDRNAYLPDRPKVTRPTLTLPKPTPNGRKKTFVNSTPPRPYDNYSLYPFAG